MKTQGRRLIVLALLVLGATQGWSQATTGNATRGMSMLEDLQAGFHSVAEQVLPTVVQLDVVEVVQAPAMTSPFQYFFGQGQGQGNNQTQQYRQQGLGSGVIISYAGNKATVLTNAHVAGDAEEITVRLYDGRHYIGKLIGSDSRKDIALVSFEPDGPVPVAKLGNSDDMKVGDWVLAIGNPLGFSSTVTSGIVSATSRHAAANQNVASFTDYIQTDAAINQGNSGGPLVNLHGEVVGINTWIASNSGGNIGIGFAVPVNSITGTIEQLSTNGKVEYGWLGAYVGDASAENPGADGAYVSNVFTGSPADKGGILPGDTITKINDTAISSANDLIGVVGNSRPGSVLRFTVKRGDKESIRRIRLDKRADESQMTNSKVWPGFLAGEDDNGKVQVAAVLDGSPAAVGGIQNGDIILRVNNASVSSYDDFINAISASASDDVYRIRLERQGVQIIVELVHPR